MNPKDVIFPWHLTAALALAAVVFGIDLFVPLGFAGGVPYLFPLLVSLRSPYTHHTLIIAVAGTALTAIGFLLSPSGGVLWIVVLNRLLALLVIWVTAILSLSRKRAETGLRELNIELEQRIVSRTNRFVALAERSQKTIEFPNLDDALESITDTATNLVRADYARISLLDEASQEFELRASSGAHGPEVSHRFKPGEGLSGKIVQLDGPAALEITPESGHAAFSGWNRETGIHSYAGCPIRRGGRVAGVIACFSKERDFFDKEDLELLATLASQAAITIENTILHQEAKARAERLEIVDNITKAIGSELDPDEIFRIISREIRNVVACDRCVVGIFDPETKTVFQFIEDTEHPIGFVIPEEDFRVEIPLQQLYRTNQPVDIPDLMDTRWREIRLAKAGYRSLLFIPVIQGELCVAYVHLSSRAAAAFNSTHIELLTSVAAHLGPAIRNAELYQEAEKRTSRLSVLNGLSRKIAQNLGLNEILENIARASVELTKGGKSRIFLLDEPTGKFNLSASYGPVPDEGLKSFGLGEGLIGTVAKSGTPTIIPDVQEDPRWINVEWAQKYNLHSYIAVPIKREDKCILIINCFSMEKNFFKEDDLEILNEFAGQAAIAIENARLHGEAKARAKRLEIVGNIANAISSELEPNELFKTIVSEIRRVVPCGRCMIVEADPKTGSLQYLHVESDTEHPLLRFGTQSKTWMSALYEKKQVVRIPDFLEVDSPNSRLLADSGIRSGILIPIIQHNRYIAHLCLLRDEPDAFTDEDEGLLVSIADQIGAAIRNASLYSQAKNRERSLSALVGLNQKITQHLNLGEVLDNVGQATLGLINADRVQIFLFDESSSMLVSHSSVGSTDDSDKTKNSFKPGEGLVGIVFQSGQPMICSDILQDSRLVNAEWFKMRGLNSYIGQPLCQAGNVIGVINAFSGPVDSFDDQDLEILEALASQASIAIENARLHGETIGRLNELNRLQEAAKSLTSGMELTDILLRVASYGEELLGASRSCIIERKDTGDLEVIFSRGLSNSYLLFLKENASELPANRAVAEKVPLVITDPTNDPRVETPPEIIAAEGYKSGLIIPLIYEGEAVGSLAFYWDAPQEFSDPMVALSRTFADHAAVAIHNARLYSDLEKRERRLGLANEIARAVGSQIKPDDLFRSVVREIRRAVPCARCVIAEEDLENQIYRYLYVESDVEVPPLELGVQARPWLDDLHNHKRPIHVADYAEIDSPNTRILADAGLHGAIYVPVIRDDRCIAHFVLVREEPDAFSGEEEELLTSISSQIGSAIQNARLYEEARKSFEFFKSVVDDNADAIIIRDLDFRIVHWNAGAEKIYGYTEKEVLGKSTKILFPESDWSRLEDREKANRGEPFHTEIHRARKDGSTVLVSATVSPVKNEDGTVIAISIIHKDLTEQKRAEETLRRSESRLAEAQQVAHIGSWEWDLLTGESIWSDELYRIHGVSKGEFIPSRKTFFERIYPADRAGVEKALEAALKDGPFDAEFHIRTPEGEERLIHSRGNVFFDAGGVPLRMFGTAQNITDRKRSEEALARQALEAQLLHRVAEVATETDSLEEALQLVVDLICGLTGWPVGHAYVPSTEKGKMLEPTPIWHLGELETYSVFREATEKTRFNIGEGLPGRILESGEPAWIADVQTEPGFSRNRDVTNLGVRGAFGFPVKVLNEVVAVLEFFANQEMSPDDNLLGIMRNVGIQLGRVFERKRAERERSSYIDRLVRLNELLQNLSASLDLDVTCPPHVGPC
jgi:PAS domain S-box-containing protein